MKYFATLRILLSHRFSLLLILLLSPGLATAQTTSLDAMVLCVDNNLEITINDGDGPFDVSGTGPGLPLSGLSTGIHTVPGPGVWEDVTVIETAGDNQSQNFGSYHCATPLDAMVLCVDNNLEITINDGDGPFDVSGTGPGLPLSGLSTGIHTVPGPGVWEDVTVIETAGDNQSQNFGSYHCTTPLDAQVLCLGVNLEITISDGDGPFDVTGTGPGLPLNGLSVGVVSLLGPGIWEDVTVIGTTGSLDSNNYGDFHCFPFGNDLEVTADCKGKDLSVLITAGDSPFNLAGSGPGLPVMGAGLGEIVLQGPGSWQGLAVSETQLDFEVQGVDDFTCQENRAIPAVDWRGLAALVLGLMLFGWFAFRGKLVRPTG